MMFRQGGPGELVVAAGIHRCVVEGGVDGPLERSGQSHLDRDGVPVVHGLCSVRQRRVRSAARPQVIGGNGRTHHVRGSGDIGNRDAGDVEAVDRSGELVVDGIDLRCGGFQLIAAVHAGQHLPVGVPRQMQRDRVRGEDVLELLLVGDVVVALAHREMGHEDSGQVLRGFHRVVEICEGLRRPPRHLLLMGGGVCENHAHTADVPDADVVADPPMSPLAGARVPPGLVVPGDGDDPVPQAVGDQPVERFVFGVRAVLGDVAAVDHERRVELFDRVEDGAQLGHRLVVLGVRVGVGEEGEAQSIVARRFRRVHERPGVLDGCGRGGRSGGGTGERQGGESGTAGETSGHELSFVIGGMFVRAAVPAC